MDWYLFLSRRYFTVSKFRNLNEGEKDGWAILKAKQLTHTNEEQVIFKGGIAIPVKVNGDQTLTIYISRVVGNQNKVTIYLIPELAEELYKYTDIAEVTLMPTNERTVFFIHDGEWIWTLGCFENSPEVFETPEL